MRIQKIQLYFNQEDNFNIKMNETPQNKNRQTNGISPWSTNKQQQQQQCLFGINKPRKRKTSNHINFHTISQINWCQFSNNKNGQIVGRAKDQCRYMANIDNVSNRIQGITRKRITSNSQNYKTERALSMNSNRYLENDERNRLKQEQKKTKPMLMQISVRNFVIGQSRNSLNLNKIKLYPRKKESSYIMKQKFAEIRKNTINSEHRIKYNKQNLLIKLSRYQ